MTTLNDVTLTQVAVLDSTMAYRDVGSPIHPRRSSCTEIRLRRISGGISFRWLRP